MSVTTLRDWLLVGGGSVSILVGAYLPWVQQNPDPPRSGIPAAIFPRMSSGFDGIDFVLLSLVGVVLLLQGVSSWTRIQATTTLLTGLGAILVCASYLSSAFTGFAAAYIPVLGWYLTVLGGVMLSVAGGVQLSSNLRSPEPPSSLKN